jgi:hypothetical protein
MEALALMNKNPFTKVTKPQMGKASKRTNPQKTKPKRTTPKKNNKLE